MLYLKNTALCFSALVTVFGAWEAFFDHRGLWVKYTRTHAQLLSIKASLDYLMLGGTDIKQEEVDALFRKFEDVIAESNDSWLQLRSESKAK